MQRSNEEFNQLLGCKTEKSNRKLLEEKVTGKRSSGLGVLD